jgi:hypothetical protein
VPNRCQHLAISCWQLLPCLVWMSCSVGVAVPQVGSMLVHTGACLRQARCGKACAVVLVSYCVQDWRVFPAETSPVFSDLCCGSCMALQLGYVCPFGHAACCVGPQPCDLKGVFTAWVSRLVHGMVWSPSQCWQCSLTVDDTPTWSVVQSSWACVTKKQHDAGPNTGQHWSGTPLPE